MEVDGATGTGHPHHYAYLRRSHELLEEKDASALDQQDDQVVNGSIEVRQVFLMHSVRVAPKEELASWSAFVFGCQWRGAVKLQQTAEDEDANHIHPTNPDEDARPPIFPPQSGELSRSNGLQRDNHPRS